MSDLHLDNLPWELRELARWLTEGKPEVGWRGDPRLILKVGVLRAAQSGYHERVGRYVRAGEELARRYEVYRHCEDGKERFIGHWHPADWHHILRDLIEMDPRTPGHELVSKTIQRHNDRVNKENSRRFREEYGAMLDHMWRLAHDRNNPAHTFRQVGGSGENVTRNLAKPEQPE